MPTARSVPAPGSPRSPACSTLTSWPSGMRVTVRKERPHPGAQLRLTDVEGHRLTDRVRHQRAADRPGQPARRPRAAPPAPGPLRGPHPLRERHRPDEPAPARLHREPDLVRDRRPRQRPHRLDAVARLHRTNRQPRRHHRAPGAALGAERLRLRLLSTAGRLDVSARQTVLHLASVVSPRSADCHERVSRVQLVAQPGAPG